ncbi:MAG: 2-succinyl-5-enolpyruvyl-6-hydroxy-3-cyclohexene-1-carboxylic-acid synthase [Candidatus Cyclobacteriaceae bacterium M2_1C_046]
MQEPFIYNIAEICSQLGIKNVILSPGSRCAPLTIAFNRHPNILVRTISDERSAGYIALGMALGTKEAVALVCTSGTAAANYLPSVAEAYYQKVPLILFTADRPPEWINQQDNQAIQQYNLYGSHAKGFYQLPVDLTHKDAKWHLVRSVAEAINLSKEYPRGPVHVNVPVREPFYPKKDEEIVFKELRITEVVEPKPDSYEFPEKLINELELSKKILILGGQQFYNNKLTDTLSQLTAAGIPVIGDLNSNLHEVDNIIIHQDTFLPQYLDEAADLQPDLLITFGDNILSKNLKLFIRNNKPQYHWHIQQSGKVADTFQSLTAIVRTDPEVFLRSLIKIKDLSPDYGFNDSWRTAESKAEVALNEYFNENKNAELTIVYHFLKSIPEDINLHLANSMSVRYANLIGLKDKKGLKVFSNRGTSGIDGSNSTAVGIAIADPTRENFLLTGDMALLYDRNAFWHNYEIENLKILVLNNHGGGIFRLIEGPSALPELNDLFETNQKLTAEYIAKEYEFTYLSCRDTEGINDKIKNFTKSKKKTILEYFSDSKENQQEFKAFKQKIKKAFKKINNSN